MILQHYSAEFHFALKPNDKFRKIH